MKIRSDFATASTYLERLILYGNVFHKNNVEHWPHLKNNEDFKNIFTLDDEARYKFEKIYSVGRDLAVYMSRKLASFNDPAEHPTLTTFIKSFDKSWLGQIEQLQDVSSQAKKQKNELKTYCPWAVEQMIFLFDEQIELLQHIIDTLNIIKTTEIYKIENAGQIMEKPTVIVQGDNLVFQNISTDGNGQVFIGKFKEAVVTLNNTGQVELATALQKLQDAILGSAYLPDDEKKEHIEVLNQIGEEAAKEKPNRTLIKVMSEGLLSILENIPDIVKIAALVIPLLTNKQ